MPKEETNLLRILRVDPSNNLILSIKKSAKTESSQLLMFSLRLCDMLIEVRCPLKWEREYIVILSQSWYKKVNNRQSADEQEIMWGVIHKWHHKFDRFLKTPAICPSSWKVRHLPSTPPHKYLTNNTTALPFLRWQYIIQIVKSSTSFSCPTLNHEKKTVSSCHDYSTRWLTLRFS